MMMVEKLEGFERAEEKLVTKVLQFLHTQSAEDRIRSLVIDLVNQALRSENVVLTNPMKDAVSAKALKTVLTEMLAELE